MGYNIELADLVYVLTLFKDDIHSFGRMRGIIIMQVLLQIVTFSLQTDGSGRTVLTKGKRP